jgi:hypothetical protein
MIAPGRDPHNLFAGEAKKMDTTRKPLLPLLTLLLVLTGLPAMAAPDAPKTAAGAAPTFTKGTVVETMDSGGYTYLCIENDGQKRWAAIPKTAIQVGQPVELAPGMEMGKYTSKSLNRTFDSIYFTSGLAASAGNLPHPIPEEGKPATTSMPPGHGMPAGHGMPLGNKPAADAPKATPIAGKVAETFEGGGYTYVAVELDGKRTWVATPPIKVTIGQSVTFVPGYVMRNFTSKSVNRTFDAILFSSGLATTPPIPAALATGN